MYYSRYKRETSDRQFGKAWNGVLPMHIQTMNRFIRKHRATIEYIRGVREVQKKNTNLKKEQSQLAHRRGNVGFN